MYSPHLPRLAAALLLAIGTTGIGMADPQLVVDPGNPGPDIPPRGRSLFDHLTADGDRQRIPYPLQALVEHIETKLDGTSAYLDRPVKQVLIPFGRSLQRNAAAPGYLESPRAVLAVDTEPSSGSTTVGMLLRDRLYVGYLEAADILEIISYNEAAARFEFQVVTDYRANGTPEVRYARRIVCIACHQNAAPIFARPLWDETNANAGIAKRLASVRDVHYGIPARQGVDIAYAIDNATDRANGFALTQLLWTQGCGGGALGQRCRAGLLKASLQYGLSGKRGYAENTWLNGHMASRFRDNWRQGLVLPDSNIPNRRPLQPEGLRSSAGSEPDNRILADVRGRDEPLNPRGTKEAWLPSAKPLTDRAVTGLHAFVADGELDRLSQRLQSLPASTRNIAANCELTKTEGTEKPRLQLDCTGSGIAFHVNLTRVDNAHTWQGRARNVRVSGNDLGALQVSAVLQADELIMKLSRRGSSRPVRLFDGDTVQEAVITQSNTGQASLQIRLRRESEAIERLTSAMIADDHAGLGNGPFVRARALGPLLRATASSDGTTTPCCESDLPFGPEVTSHEGQLPPDTELDPFIQVCGGCHRSTEPFPPNFLSGPAEQVRTGIVQCAERIRFRLAMWDLDPDRRPKSPMPPHLTGTLLKHDLPSWENGLLPRLRDALDRILSRMGHPETPRLDIVRRPYIDLRPCLASR